MDQREYLEAVIAANVDRISESVRRGEEQIASGAPLFKCPKCGNPTDTPQEALMHCASLK